MSGMDDSNLSLRKRVEEKVKTFNIGDKIQFYLYIGNEMDCEFEGIIQEIQGNFANVKFQYGQCRAWLPISKKIT